MSSDGRPFDGLEPGVILEAAEHFGVRCDGRLLALNSFENRVYQIGVEDGPSVVAKFYRPGRWSNDAILEEHAFSLEFAGHEIPVVPPLRDGEGRTLVEYAGFRFALYPSRGGYWPELQEAEDRRQLGRFIGRMHAVGALRAFEHRPAIDVESYGEASARFLLENDFLPPGTDTLYQQTSNTLLEHIREQFEKSSNVRRIRLHGDLHRGNILWSSSGPAIVDLDDCRTGPAVQDLWMLLAGSSDEMRLQMSDFLAGYRTFYEFSARELALVEALRALRIMHHAAWIARRWSDPAFPRAFPWFGTPSYWEGHLSDLKEQIAQLEEPPLEVI
ncbi:MAG TPA: serine/threonine protein kinase [Gammaproteobacteria bacterium]|nr:serine/threonine protein kinase [Gammaproteobacteria bacterium]